MAGRRQTCLISSDEEDEDGNLSETAPVGKNNSIPQREVVYLPEHTHSLKSGEEISKLHAKESGNISGSSIKVKTIDALRNTPGSKTGPENIVGKSNSLKADDLTPLPTKKDSSNTIENNSFKKAKYARQATPICDAIMKEYSKRQRIIKQKGSGGSTEVNDMPIQDLLKKAKDKGGSEVNVEKGGSEVNVETGGSEVNVEKETPSKNNAQVIKVTPSEEIQGNNNSDPLTIVKQEIIDVKPEVLYVPVNLAEVKQEQCDSELSSRTSNQTSSVHGRGRGRPRGRGRATKGGSQRKRKWQISDDEDDTDEDPDFDPSVDKTTSRRVTRYNRRTANYQNPVTQEKVVYVNQENTSESTLNHESVMIPKEQAINVAERLKSLAEKIADVLTKDPSPNINSEAEKLLHTTQELIELQKKSLQSTEKVSLPGSTVKIKQEIIDPTENNNETSSSLNMVENTTCIPNPPKQNAVQIYNQLQKHEAALQKKLSESVTINDQVLNITERVLSTNLPNTGSQVSSGPVSVSIKEKCTFIMDFFTSYQEVFDEHTVKSVIPILSDTIMLCYSELTECIQRMKKAEALKSVGAKQQEMNLAKQSYLNTIISSGKTFFPLFNNLVEQISRTKTSNALINTLILSIAGSLFTKNPTLIISMHRFKKLLLFMNKTHKQYHQLVSQVLMTPDDVFDRETKYIRHLLKYFQARNFLKIPAEYLCTYPDVSVEEESQFQEELSVMDTAILKHINSSVNVVDSTPGQNYTHLRNTSSSSSNLINQLRRSNITAEFVEGLQNEREGNTKRMKEKLDYVLNVLSGNAESHGVNLNISQNKPRKPQNRHEKETVEHNQSQPTLNLELRVNLGKRVPNVPTVKLSSLQETNTSLSTWPKTTICDQPDSLPDDKGMLLAQLLEEDHVGLDSLFSSYLNSNTENTIVRIKSEPVDTAETFSESAEILAQPYLIPVKQEPCDVVFTETGIENASASIVCEQPLLEDAIFNDSFTEEYNFTKTEQDINDVDPLT